MAESLNLISALDINVDELMDPHQLFPDSKYFSWVTSTFMTCLVILAFVILFGLIVRFILVPRWRKKTSPGVLQTMLEAVIGMFESEGREATGHNAKWLAPWYIGAAFFIFFGTLAEMLGVRPPISDLNVTLALGLSTFIIIWIFGFKEKKFFGRMKRYVFNPINLITDTIIPFSMALRLFGSVFSGYIIMHLIYQLGWVSLILGPIGVIIATLFHAFIQAYIFMMLSYAFIGEATE